MIDNPYTAWLANPEQPLPLPYNRGAVEAVWKNEYATHLQHRAEFETKATYDNFYQWLTSKRRIAVLMDILWIGNSLVAGKDEQPQKKFYQQCKRKYQKLLQQEYHYRTRLTQLLQNKRLSATKQKLLAQTKAELYKADPDELDIINNTVTKRRENFLAKHPGVLIPDPQKLRGIDVTKVIAANEKARKNGKRGFLIERSAAITDEIIEQCQDRGTREQVWGMTQRSACISDRSTRKVLNARKRLAKEYGFQSYSQHELDGCLQSNPKTVSRNLKSTLEHSSNLYNQCLTYLGKLGKQRFGINNIDEWDVRFLENKFNEQHCGKFPEKEFPWEATILKAVPELLNITGWRADMVAKRGKGKATTYTWRLERQGKINFLTVVPYQINDVKDLFTEGFAVMVRAGSKNTMHAVIQLLANPKSPGFDLLGLETLAHEVGHVMHWLALPNKVKEAMSPGDFAEVPSTLLEQYPRDPKVLARWSKNQIPEAYWHQFDQYDMIRRVKWLFTEHYSSWLNLVVNGKNPPKSLKKFVMETMEGFGITENTRGTWWLDKLMQVDDGVGTYIYPFAYSLNNRLYGNLEIQPDAMEIAKVYKKMERKVLRHTHLGPQSIKLYWKEMMGETLLQSLKKGEKARLAAMTMEAQELGQQQQVTLRKLVA